MPCSQLTVSRRPHLDNARLIIGLSGWMDGGQVSIGTVETLVNKVHAQEIARIEPDGFYIYNFPGSMEISAVFRPHVEIHEGLLKRYHEPENIFLAASEQQLVFFLGKEPNLNWHSYTDCILDVIEQCNVKEVYFIGSVAGLVPHSREPRISSTVSDKALKSKLTAYNIKFTNYHGPGSVINHLLATARQRGIEMTTLVTEIPAYIQGQNVKCIEAMVRRLNGLLSLDLDFEDLRRNADELEQRIDQAIKNKTELAEHIKTLEANYDEEVFDTEMGDLKNWLEEQGIRVD